MYTMTLLILLSFVPFSAQAKEFVALSPSCPNFEVTGIESKEKFLAYFEKLKSAAEKGDASGLSEYVLLPLRVNKGEKSHKIFKSLAKVKKESSEIFSKVVIKAIQNQKVNELFCRDEGVMIGEGEAWIHEKNHKIGIYVVNL